MASILKGDSEHKTFAPLTHSQTLQICQHLESLIGSLDTKVNDLRENLTVTDTKVDRLQNALSMTDSTVISMKETSEADRASVEHLQTAFAELDSGVSYIHKGLDQTNDQVNALREGLKVTNTNASGLKEDIDGLKTEVKKINVILGNDSSSHIHTLEEEIKSCQRHCQKLSEETALNKSGLQQEKEFLQTTCKELNETGNRLTHTDKAVSGLEEVLQQARHDLKTTRTTLEETNAVVIKIHEDHEHLKATMKGHAKGFADHKVRFDNAERVISKTAQNMENVKGELSQTGAKLDASCKIVENTVNAVKSLREGFQMHDVCIANVTQGVEHVGAMAQQTKLQIAETSSLLLPNLHLENDNPASNSVMGTLSMASMGASSAAHERSMANSEATQSLPTTSRSKRTGGSKTTPRVKHTQAWLLRNIGTSPDRMAMI